jgi:hypothetical protein
MRGGREILDDLPLDEPPTKVWLWAEKHVPSRIPRVNDGRYPYRIVRATLFLLWRTARPETALGLRYLAPHGRVSVDQWIRTEYRDEFPRPSLETLRKKPRDAMAHEVAGDAPYKLVLTGDPSSSSFIGSWDYSRPTAIFGTALPSVYDELRRDEDDSAD